MSKEKEITKEEMLYGVASIGDIKCISSFEKTALGKWKEMIDSCYNDPHSINKVSDEWLCFKNYYEDLPEIQGYSESVFSLGGLILSMIDESLNIYSKDNCSFRKLSKSIVLATKDEGDNIEEIKDLDGFANSNSLEKKEILKVIDTDGEYNGWRFSYKKDPIVIVTKVSDWNLVLDTARLTINKGALYKMPSEEFKSNILLAEHSPIRTLQYLIEIKNIPSWVSQHIARHDAFAGHTVREGVADTHFVGTQRTDRTGINRDKMPQTSPVNHTIFLNSQDLINISRKRFCNCASKETREIWTLVVDEIRKIDPVLASKCVPECIYRGFCPEFMSNCKYSETLDYKKRLVDYRSSYLPEEWKVIQFIPEVEISNLGGLRFTETKDLIRTKFDGRYLFYNWNNYRIYPHLLVLELFKGYSELNDPDEVCHIDGNPINNNINNLRIK